MPDIQSTASDTLKYSSLSRQFARIALYAITLPWDTVRSLAGLANMGGMKDFASYGLASPVQGNGHSVHVYPAGKRLG